MCMLVLTVHKEAMVKSMADGPNDDEIKQNNARDVQCDLF